MREILKEASEKINKLVTIKDIAHFDTPEGKNLHLVLDCPWCEQQHRRSIKAGGTYDYDKYTPHVSIMYNCGKFIINTGYSTNNRNIRIRFIGTKFYGCPACSIHLYPNPRRKIK